MGGGLRLPGASVMLFVPFPKPQQLVLLPNSVHCVVVIGVLGFWCI